MNENEVFDPNAARLRVASALKSGSREILKTELRAFIGEHSMPRAEREAARTQLDVMSEEDSPGSHSRVFSGGVWRELAPSKPSQGTLDERALIRKELENPQISRRRQDELHAQLTKTYERK